MSILELLSPEDRALFTEDEARTFTEAEAQQLFGDYLNAEIQGATQCVLDAAARHPDMTRELLYELAGVREPE